MDIPKIEPYRLAEEVVDNVVDTSQQGAEAVQKASEEVKNTSEDMVQQIDDILNQINQLKSELEGKINEVKDSVANEVGKTNLNEIKEKIDTLSGLPGKLTELQDKYKYYSEH